MSDSMGQAVFEAAEKGNEAELTRLIGLGGNVNWRNPGGGYTGLIKASWNGYEGCVRLLLEAEAIEVNAKSNGDWTALHYAATFGHLAIAKRLLEGGADPTLRTKYGNETALDIARQYGRSEVVALLSEPRYAARMHTDCPSLPSGCAEAPSWAHADHGFSAARRTNGGQSSWDEIERTQRPPHGATRQVANAHP
jgi:uncharacterized protein